MKKNIFLIDDHQIVLEGILSVLSGIKNYELYPFTSPIEALNSSKLQQCELIILDLSMDEMHGLDFITAVKEKGDFKILVFTNHGEIWNISKILNQKVCGIVHKNDFGIELKQGVLDVLDGFEYFSPLIEEVLQYIDKKEIRHLAPREKQILQLTAEGFIVKEIANQLTISPTTVTATHKKICFKLEAKNIANAVKIASERGDLN